MTCQNCGRYAPADAETGYDADELCPECEREKDQCAYDEAADAARAEYEEDRLRDLEPPF
jgi:hypothetical protein